MNLQQNYKKYITIKKNGKIINYTWEDIEKTSLVSHLFKLPARQISDGLHRIQKKWISDSEEKSKKDSQEGGSDDDDRTPRL